jgi:glycosyltransferase involved in cell wall biosynthesis
MRKWIAYPLLDGPVLRGAVRIHCTSSHEANELPTEWMRAKAFVVPVPIPVAEPDGSDSRRFRIIFLGRITAKKKVDLFIRICVALAAAGCVLIPTIAGAATQVEKDEVERVRQRFQLERLDLFGFVGPSERDRLLRESAVFLLPSDGENFGLAPVEALVNGVAVATTSKVDSIASLPRSSRIRLVDSADPQDWVEPILELHRGRDQHDPDLQHALMTRYGDRHVGDALVREYEAAGDRTVGP